MYKLIFEKRALHQLNKLTPITKRRIWDRLQLCKANPFHFLEPLVQIPAFKLRVGDYRIIIEVKEKLEILNILKIGHRKNVYER